LRHGAPQRRQGAQCAIRIGTAILRSTERVAPPRMRSAARP
jgi:hypothetical protein